MNWCLGDPGPCPVCDAPHTTCCAPLTTPALTTAPGGPLTVAIAVPTPLRPPDRPPETPPDTPPLATSSGGSTRVVRTFTTRTYRRRPGDMQP